MKKIIFYALTLSVFVFGPTVAQTVTEQNLSAAILSSENVKQEVTTSRKAVNLLVKQLTIIGNPNATLFANSVTNSNDEKEVNANDINSYVALAQSNSSTTFAITAITAQTDKIFQQNHVISVVTNQIATAVNAGNNSLALNLVPSLRTALTRQLNASNTITIRIKEFQLLVKTYNVCIKVIDNQGNTVDYQPGFGATNTVTGEGLYPNNDLGNQNGGTCFLNMLAGTYSFSGFPDYFCGVSSSGPITLSDSLLNEDGIIEITLVQWCE